MNKFFSLPSVAAAFILMAVGGYAWAQYAPGTNYATATVTTIQGNLDIASGGTLDVESGGVFAIAGTTVTSSANELNIMTGVTANEAEIDRVSDVSARIVTITATGSITAAANGDRINLLGEVGGNALVTLTLPEATGSGNRYKFYVSVINTSSYIIDALTSDTMSGVIMTLQDGGDTMLGWEVDNSDDSIELNGTDKGGVAIGDWLEFIDCIDTTWCVSGQTTSSGTEITPAASS